MNYFTKKSSVMLLYSLLVITSIVDCMESSFEKIKNLERNESIHDCLKGKCPLILNCMEELIENQFQCPFYKECLVVQDPLTSQEKNYSQVSEEVHTKFETAPHLSKIKSIIPSCDFVDNKKVVEESLETWGPLLSVAYTFDGRYILAVSVDCTARLFEAQSGKLVRVIQ